MALFKMLQPIVTRRRQQQRPPPPQRRNGSCCDVTVRESRHNTKLLPILLLLFLSFNSTTFCVSVTAAVTSARARHANDVLRTHSTYSDSTSTSHPHQHDHDHHHSDTSHANPVVVDQASHRNPNNTTTTDQCQNRYMTMYMDGFRWSILSSYNHRTTTTTSQSTPPSQQKQQRPPIVCLNFLISTWRVQNATDFAGCMIVTFFLALLLEGVAMIRKEHVDNWQHQRSRASYGDRISNDWNCVTYYVRHAFVVLTFGVQGLIGYILMFIAMSYSMELMISIVLGLILGNAIFVRYDDDGYDTSASSSSLTSQYDDYEEEEDNNDDVDKIDYETNDHTSRVAASTIQSEESYALIPSNNTGNSSTGIVRRRG
jgi:Ctr copper transporter family